MIRSDGFKVVLSGEGSDELWASYRHSRGGIRRWGWDGYRRRLLGMMSYTNFPRSNKVFMKHAVECRMPFLSTGLVEFALGLPRHLVSSLGRPKALIQDAFSDVLPLAVTRRKKLPFHRGLRLDREVPLSPEHARRELWGTFRDEYPGNEPLLPDWARGNGSIVRGGGGA